jgi:hypothetical protein
MTDSNLAFIRVATSNGDAFSSSLCNDLLIYTSSSNQNIVFKEYGGVANRLVVSSNNIQVNVPLTVNGVMTVASNITPSVTETYNLGSATLRYKDVWLSGNTIHLGTMKLSADGSNLVVKTATDQLGSVAMTEIVLQANSNATPVKVVPDTTTGNLTFSKLNASGVARNLSDTSSFLGYDIVVAMGADNIVGQDTLDSSLDRITDTRLQQLGYIGTDLQNRTILALDPLQHILNATSNTVGPVTSFSRYYMKNNLANGRKVLIVPCGQADSGFSDGKWTASTGALYQTAVQRTKIALAYDELLNPLPAVIDGVYPRPNPNNKVAAILWVGGMKDVAYANFTSDLVSMVNNFRQDISNTTVPFVYSEFAPEWIAADSATRSAFNTTLGTVTSNLTYSKCASAYTPFTLASKSNVPQHFSAASSRELGRRLFTAYHSLVNNVSTNTAAFATAPTFSNYPAFGASDARVGVNFSLNSNVHYVQLSYSSNVLYNIITSPYTVSNLQQGTQYTFTVVPGNLINGNNVSGAVSSTITA